MTTGPWPEVAFDQVLMDVSAGNPKTKAREFLDAGELPLVDQGQALVGGFTNDLSRRAVAPLPLIVFGDHTRAVKYVDFPFGVGADGVKVLRPVGGADVRYLYWALKSLRLPASAYDRHFKHLRRSTIPLPPLEEQRRIAAVLDQADALRAKRRASLDLLDSLTESIFLDMFGDDPSQPRSFVRDLLAIPLRNGVSPANGGAVSESVLTLSAITGVHFQASAQKVAPFSAPPSADRRVSVSDLLICRGNGNRALVGRAQRPSHSDPSVVFPDTMIAARFRADLVVSGWIDHVWNRLPVRMQLERAARTTNGTHKINQEMIEGVELPVPPIERQMEFEHRASASSGAARDLDRSATELDALFASLQQRAFSGQL